MTRPAFADTIIHIPNRKESKMYGHPIYGTTTWADELREGARRARRRRHATRYATAVALLGIVAFVTLSLM